MKYFKTSFKQLYLARHEPENLRPIAEMYWRGLLVLSVCAVAAIIVFGLWEFSLVMGKISKASSGAGAPAANVLDRAKLEATILEFSERRAEFELAKKGTAAVPDPSR
jgi:hypothetical protein